ncbi:MAG: hypothetical protein IAF02_13760 [Anaerolineae bacterium]|nr:hypothetical protein [Anaerolineae bacterium]
MSNLDDLKQENKMKDRYTRRQERRERRAVRRADRQAGGWGWISGLILIAIGLFYLLQPTGFLPNFTNWWALFLLLPAVGVLSAALGAYRRNGGQWTGEVTGLFLGGLLFLGITAVFLFNLDFSWFTPLFLIAAGLLLLIAAGRQGK